MWKDLVHQCRLLAKNQVEATLERELIRLFSLVDSEDHTVLRLFQSMEARPVADYQTHMLLDEADCRIMLILLQKEGEVGLHNHPNQHGFIYCYRGSVLIEAFEERSATESEAVLARVFRKKLGAGDSAFLTPKKQNIHRLFGTECVWLIDVFIPPLQEEDIDLCRRYEYPHRDISDDLCLAKIIPRPVAE